MTDSNYLPFAPLEEYMIQHLRPSEDHISDVAMAAEIGVDTTTVNRWRRAGKITWISADSAAVKLGQHPLSIWDSSWIAIDSGIYSGEITKSLAKKLDCGLERIGEVCTYLGDTLVIHGPPSC